MDLLTPEVVAIGVVAMSLAWIVNTYLRVRHGYPLEGMWGQSLRPVSDREATERVKLVTQENAQLRAEMSALKDRLANVERIVTDSGYQLTHEIDRLRQGAGDGSVQ